MCHQTTQILRLTSKFNFNLMLQRELFRRRFTKKTRILSLFKVQVSTKPNKTESKCQFQIHLLEFQWRRIYRNCRWTMGQ